MRLSRRRFLFGSLAVTAAAGAYAGVFEPRRLVVSETTVPLARVKLNKPIRIAHLSDLHASPVVSLGFLERAVDLTIAESPDVICITGDFISARHLPLREYSAVLKRLSEVATTYCCLGNHDGGPWAARGGGFSSGAQVAQLLEESGCTLLHNRSVVHAVGQQQVRLLGVGDLWSRECRPEEAYREVTEDEQLATIVLSHNPDAKKEFSDFHWDVMLCGHTHGGQMRIPFIGTPFAPIVDRNFVEGLRKWRGRWIYVTRGVGNLYGLRINCPPEISILTVS